MPRTSYQREKGLGDKFIKSRLNLKKGYYNQMNTYISMTSSGKIKELKSMMREKQFNWCRFVNGGRKDLRLLEKHREQCKIVKKRMKKCISDYEISLATSHARNHKAI